MQEIDAFFSGVQVPLAIKCDSKFECIFMLFKECAFSLWLIIFSFHTDPRRASSVPESAKNSRNPSLHGINGRFSKLA